MNPIETNDKHPYDLLTHSDFVQDRLKVEKQLIERFANGEKEVKHIVHSTSGNGKTYYIWTAKKIPVESIDDCEAVEVAY